ncbi:uncharacterized protein N7515_000462 [Penicillium bovifimosum]|uniref:Xylanolytic transcriptional activator regulatory domain-containing protein n=1 Tax=Penicillium bovifimosum TaxID=126998 RepID=A0A9W9LBK9_9EURO|nr:uncharacterized protein N7515_000462 [Penicillium bovifimosum]KAJ5145898.1 hypothetical protein N7515_000462 [Penicillium bovifimosum]
MQLLITEPSNTGGYPDKVPLYVFIKAIIPAMELRNPITLQNIQARLLICLYEIGHMIQPSLFLSISTVARCAIAVGCNRSVKSTESPTKDWVSREEEKRVWWTIYILDSYVPILTGFCNFVTDDPALDDCLPIEDNLWVTDAFPVPEPLPLMTPANVRVGPLARTVQAAHLLRRTTVHVRRSTGNEIFNVNEAAQIYGVMTCLSDLITQQATDLYCMNFCGAISMCNSARILLHHYHQIDERNRHYESCNHYFGTIAESCSTVIHMAKRFNSIATIFDANALNPLLPFSIYQAGSALAISDEWNLEEDKQHSLKELKEMLCVFSQRWKIADYHLEKLASTNTNEKS